MLLFEESRKDILERYVLYLILQYLDGYDTITLKMYGSFMNNRLILCMINDRHKDMRGQKQHIHHFTNILRAVFELI